MSGEGWVITPPPSRPNFFSLNNPERYFTAFINILLETFVPSLISLIRPSLHILGKTHTGLFSISGQSLINENWHNSRTSNDIDMKLGPVTKLDKKKATASKKVYGDVMSANCDAIIIFSMYDEFGAIRKPDFGRMV